MNKDIADKKVKVFFVIPNLGRGGAEQILSLLLKQLDRNKIQLYCIFYDSHHVHKIPDDVKVYDLGIQGTSSLHKKIYYSIKRMIVLKKIINTEKPDVVFSFILSVNLTAICIKLLSRNFNNRIKFIINEVSTPSVELKEKMNVLLKIVRRCLVKFLYPKADKIIAVSGGVKKDLVMSFNVPEEKITVICPSVDIERVKVFSKDKLNGNAWFNDNVPIIINVASLREAKRQDCLLKAFKLVREKLNCRLVIIGEGEKENELKELAKHLRISDDIKFLRHQENIYKFIGRSTVFVLSSQREGFPTVLIEAMACSVPIISTRCQSGPEEIITDSVDGLLVPVEDVEKMAEAILNVISNKDLSASLVAEAKTTVLKYGIEIAIKDYERLIVSSTENGETKND